LSKPEIISEKTKLDWLRFTLPNSAGITNEIRDLSPLGPTFLVAACCSLLQNVPIAFQWFTKMRGSSVQHGCNKGRIKVCRLHIGADAHDAWRIGLRTVYILNLEDHPENRGGPRHV
jgi:hypothetical protein